MKSPPLSSRTSSPGSRGASLPRVFWSVIFGWLVPGVGHAVAGAWQQGAWLFVLIAGTFWSGLVMSDFEAVSRDLHPYAFGAQIGVGGVTLPLLWVDPARDKVLAPRDSIERPQRVPRHNDTGVLFCSIAGLLNALVLFDLIDRQVNRRLNGQLNRQGRRRERAT